jgi:secreted Zn-dependent insulinase-like peptidase
VVEISFPFEWQPPYWRHHPSSFLAHFIRHKGPGSLYSYLKNNGWTTALRAGQQNLARGFAMFKVTFFMTEVGFGASLSPREITQLVNLFQKTTHQSFLQLSNIYLSSGLRSSRAGGSLSGPLSRKLASVS